MATIGSSNIQPPDFNPNNGEKIIKDDKSPKPKALPLQGPDEFKTASVQSGQVSSVNIPPTNVERVAPPIPSAVSETKEISEVVKPVADAVEGFGQFLSAGATERLGRLAFGPERRAIDGLPISERAKVKLADAAITKKNNQVS